MKLNLTPFAMAATMLSLLPSVTMAQAQNCAERTMVLDRLSNNYGETRQSIGLGANNAVVEVFASDETGTWTITVTLPDGKTCLIASGQAFEALAEDKLMIPGNDA